MEPTPYAHRREEWFKSEYGVDRIATIRSNKCTRCIKDATHFKDQLSVDEYKISGMCQDCQDIFWGQFKDDE